MTSNKLEQNLAGADTALSTCRNGQFSEMLPDLLSMPSSTKYVTEDEIQELVETSGRKKTFWGVILINYQLFIKITQEKYELGSQYVRVHENPIGTGAYAVVYLCADIQTKFKFVEKITSIQHYSLVQREVKVLTSFDFQHVVKLLGMITNERQIRLFLEYGGTSLYWYFNFNFYVYGVQVPPNKLKAIFSQVLEACIELHTRNLVHCDLHQGNILANENDFIKFCDLSSLKSTQDKIRIYTPSILPPRMLSLYLKEKRAKEIQEQQVELYIEQHALKQKQVSLAETKRALLEDAKQLEKKQIDLLGRQFELLEEKTRLQAEINQVLQHDEEISYQYASSRLEEFQQQQNALGRELDDIDKEQSQLLDQERQLHQQQMDISASQENIQKQQAILRQKTIDLLKQQVADHEKAINSPGKLENVTVSPRLDTYAVGKLLVEALVKRAIPIKELEPHIYNENDWENFVRSNIPETFWKLDPTLCQLILDLMSFTTKIDAKTALQRCK